MTTTSRTLQALALGLCLAPAAGAHELAGSVRTPDGRPVAGARVAADARETRSDDRGFFRLEVPGGHRTLQASRDGHDPASLELDVDGPRRDLEILLAPTYRVSEEVVVQAVRADARAPITRRDLGSEELGRLNHGQEMPVLLQQTPSLNFSSDAGNGTGYSSIYLRGIQQTRINMTLDGAPLNEAEDGALYFADFGDFASALGSIQVQRGVGTSTVGSAAYAGSINFASLDLAERPSADARITAGSFGTQRAGLSLHSGALGGFKLFARGAYQESDGFRDRSGVRQRTLFFGATRQDDRSFLKVFGFGGVERTQLSFYAVEPQVLEQDLTNNPLRPEETDRFGQRFVHAQYTRALGTGQTLTVQAYRNAAGGSYRLFDSADLLEYGLDWVNWGGQASYRRTWGPNTLTWGAHGYRFASHHLQDVVGGGRNYQNQGFKHEASSFLKLTRDSGRWHLYGDAQLRFARFRYEGRIDLGSVDWTFFNPKVGARLDLSSRWSAYASVGRSGREPGRSDLLTGEDDASLPYDLTAVRPEHVVDVEAGLELHRPGLSIQANVFVMEFRDEIAQTGEVSEIGYGLRRNAESSFRRGLELDAAWEPLHGLRLTHASSFTWARIREWTQFYDVYDADFAYLGSTSRSFQDVAPLLTPAVIVNQGVEWRPHPVALLAATGRYVGQGWLDNTNTSGIETPDYFDLGLAATLDLSKVARRGAPRLRVQVDNVLDGKRHWPTGYSYLYAVRGPGGDAFQGTPYFYPLATRSVLVSLDVAF